MVTFIYFCYRFWASVVPSTGMGFGSFISRRLRFHSPDVGEDSVYCIHVRHRRIFACRIRRVYCRTITKQWRMLHACEGVFRGYVRSLLVVILWPCFPRTNFCGAFLPNRAVQVRHSWVGVTLIAGWIVAAAVSSVLCSRCRSWFYWQTLIHIRLELSSSFFSQPQKKASLKSKFSLLKKRSSHAWWSSTVLLSQNRDWKHWCLVVHSKDSYGRVNVF